jgi:hypothetical protein
LHRLSLDVNVVRPPLSLANRDGRFSGGTGREDFAMNVHVIVADPGFLAREVEHRVVGNSM